MCLQNCMKGRSVCLQNLGKCQGYVVLCYIIYCGVCILRKCFVCGEKVYIGGKILIQILIMYIVNIFLFVYDMKKGDCSFDLQENLKRQTKEGGGGEREIVINLKVNNL